jgi:hypothetical protein
LAVATYIFAHFYEAMGASARSFLTPDPVETKHPRVTGSVYYICSENAIGGDAFTRSLPPVLEHSLDLAPGLALGLRLALVVQFLAPGKSYHDLRFSLLEPDL